MHGFDAWVWLERKREGKWLF